MGVEGSPVALGETRRHVLVVDDDPAICEAVRDVLGEEGYVVSTAEGGIEAWRQLTSSAATPDLVLVDLMMPEVDGWELVSRMRQAAPLAFVPVVIISAGGSAMLARAPVASGYVTKPIGVPQLLSIVKRSLGLRAHPGQLASSSVSSVPPPPPLEDEESAS